jgi:hypothetical protein
MTVPNDYLDHAVRLFPEPDGALGRVHERYERRQRNRRLAAIATVAGIWITFGGAFALLGPREESRPVDAPTPAGTPYVESGDLPSAFPADFPIPEGVQPVAHHTEEGYVQVWFRSSMSGAELHEHLVATLPQSGWGPPNEGSTPGAFDVWELHPQSKGRFGTVIILRTSPVWAADLDAFHGTDNYPGDWDLYVSVSERG